MCVYIQLWVKLNACKSVCVCVYVYVGLCEQVWWVIYIYTFHVHMLTCIINTDCLMLTAVHYFYCISTDSLCTVSLLWILYSLFIRAWRLHDYLLYIQPSLFRPNSCTGSHDARAERMSLCGIMGVGSNPGWQLSYFNGRFLQISSDGISCWITLNSIYPLRDSWCNVTVIV